MKIHELEVAANPDKKRVGRGIGSGYGKTAGRGTKGQNSRTGGGVRLGFEGGQNPLAKRLPKKRGFKSLNRVDYQVVNLADLAKAKGNSFSPESLLEAKLIGSSKQPVKILGDGDIDRKLSIKTNAISNQARVKVEKAGGTIELLSSKTRD